MKKKPTPRKVKDKIVKAIREGRVRWRDDVGLANPTNPDDHGLFVRVDLDAAWNRKDSKGFVISWGAKGIGFGEVTFYKKNGRLRVESEHMGREFVKKVFAALVDATEWDWEPERRSR